MDDQNLAARSIGREVRFCPLAGVLKRKGLTQIQDESEIREDKLFMREIRKIAETIIPMLKTEEDCPGNHPELGFKVPILDVAMWVEEVMIDAKGLDIHSQCEEGSVCLPIENLNTVVDSEGGLE